jgi:membrane-associated protease RseP (regulator of RpoE activity)
MSTDRLQHYAEIKRAIDGVIDIRTYEFHDNGGVLIRGQLRAQPADVIAKIQPRLGELGLTGHLQHDGAEHLLIVIPGVARFREITVSARLSITLFLLTFLSATVTGGLRGDSPDPSTWTINWIQGLIQAATVMSILLAHEMGHYVVARLRGESATLPLFIPLPVISLGGTLGAVILQTKPFASRRTLLEVGIAGPLAGFLVAVPLFIIGAFLSTGPVTPVPPNPTILGDSLLTLLIGSSILGEVYTSTTQMFEAHPMLMGAWIGLLITGINLIPAGQLDGGHIAYALLGDRAKYLTYAVIAGSVALSFLSQSWIVWTLLLIFFGRTHPPVNNPHMPLTFVPRPLYQL